MAMPSAHLNSLLVWSLCKKWHWLNSRGICIQGLALSISRRNLIERGQDQKNEPLKFASSAIFERKKIHYGQPWRRGISLRNPASGSYISVLRWILAWRNRRGRKRHTTVVTAGSASDPIGKQDRFWRRAISQSSLHAWKGAPMFCRKRWLHRCQSWPPAYPA